MTNVDQRLRDIATQVAAVVKDYYEDFKPQSLNDTPIDIHDRILGTQQVRSYLSEQVATLVLINGALQVELKKKEFELTKAEADAITKVKLKDFDTKRVQELRMVSHTMDLTILCKQTERDLIDSKMVLDYVREHLQEFIRKGYDLSNRVKILSSAG